jgi:tetratricopeptide (TPR) repeat protein
MRPYAAALNSLFLVCVVLAAVIFPPMYAWAEKPAKRPHPPAANLSGARLSALDPLTKSGFTALYNLEYDKAISDFDRALKAHPDDASCANHLLQAILFKELYRLNALDTTLYADNGFLTGKPLAGDPQVKAHIFRLAEKNLQVTEQRLKANPNDVEALYAHGVTRGLKLTYSAIIEKSFFASLRNASASRGDHEKVLQLDPSFTDAKLLVGMHNFVLGSMPLAARIMAGIVGMSGSKKKGMDYLYEGGRSNGETSVDARVALALFLRREGRYNDALEIMRTLSTQYPRNFIFGLEEANLLKDAGLGQESIAAYIRLLENGKAGMYADPHLERAAFGLAEAMKGQRQVPQALKEYEAALAFNNLQPDIKMRALVGAGEMYDVLGQRDLALRSYNGAIALDSDSPQAAMARRFVKQPFQF